ncbi:MAG: DUF6427 family protein [Aequorivita sp.]
MLTSFFGKSKPIHFLILGVILVLSFIWTLFARSTEDITLSKILISALLIAVTVLSMIVLDFLVSKNHLTKTNTYAIFFYSGFLLMLPIIFLDSNVLLANIFLLLALRRIMSLRNDNNSEKKIFDAALWITVASLFYFWSMLFFVPLYLALIQKPNVTFKQMLIPPIGLLAVFIINTAYQLLVNDSFGWIFEWHQSISFDFSAYNAFEVLIPATLLIGFLVWTGIYRLGQLPMVSLKDKTNYILVMIVALTTLVIAACGPEKTGAELLFVLTPTAIMFANYIEGGPQDGFAKKDQGEFWFKEILLWSVAVLSIVFLLI